MNNQQFTCSGDARDHKSPAVFIINILIATFLAAASSTGRAATTIDTIPLWNGTAFVSSWGGGGSTPTYGQTFTAPTDNLLENITFMIRNNSGSSINFQPFVFSWNGTAITGSALFAGNSASIASSADYQIVATSTNSTALVAGQQYVAFYTTTTTAPTAGGATWGQPGQTNPYVGGAFVYSNAGTFDGLTSPWSQSFLGTGGDLAFSMTFVPEPTSALLVGLGSLALLLHRRRDPANSYFTC